MTAKTVYCVSKTQCSSCQGDLYRCQKYLWMGRKISRPFYFNSFCEPVISFQKAHSMRHFWHTNLTQTIYFFVGKHHSYSSSTLTHTSFSIGMCVCEKITKNFSKLKKKFGYCVGFGTRELWCLNPGLSDLKRFGCRIIKLGQLLCPWQAISARNFGENISQYAKKEIFLQTSERMSLRCVIFIFRGQGTILLIWCRQDWEG